MLRPGEMAAIQRCHVRLPADHVGMAQQCVIVCIVKAKTRFRAARVQSVVITAPVLLNLARSALLGVPQSAALLPGGGTELRRRFDSVLQALGLQAMPYSPASLRPGGALSMFQRASSGLMEVMYRGRWDNAKTLSHYLQEGVAALALHSVPPRSVNLVRGLAASSEAYCGPRSA